MIKLSYEQQIAFNSLSIIVGNALYALTVVLFLVPSGLITGGATGIALGINRCPVFNVSRRDDHIKFLVVYFLF